MQSLRLLLSIIHIAKAMGVNTDGMTESEGIRAAVDAVRKLSLSIGIPQKLHEINVKEEDLHQLAVDAFNDVCTGGNPRPTSVEEIEALYRKAFLIIIQIYHEENYYLVCAVF